MAQKFTLYSIFEAVDKITAPVKRMNTSLKSFSDSVNHANSIGRVFTGTLGALGVSASISGIIAYGKEIKNVAMQQASLAVAYKSVFGADAVAQLKFAKDTASQLGLGQQAMAESYMKIGAAAQGTKNAAQDVQQVFIGVSQAASALQMDTDAVQGSLYAISQMMSKGKVMAEELRGQLGERLPGAFNIAARAMGVTTAKLDKMLSLGNVAAEKFIPLFAKQLQKEFAPAALEASKGFLGIENRFKNMVNTVQGRMGLSLLPALATLYEKLTPVILAFADWAEKNKTIIGQNMQDIVMGIVGAVKLLADGWNSGVIPAILGAVVAIKAASVAMTVFNSLSAANPWVLVIMAIGSAVGYVASQVGGVGNALITMGQSIGTVLLAPINLVIDAIRGLLLLVGQIPGIGTGAYSAVTSLQSTMNKGILGSSENYYDASQPFRSMMQSEAIKNMPSPSDKSRGYNSTVQVDFTNLPQGAAVQQSEPAPGFTLNTGKTTAAWGY